MIGLTIQVTPEKVPQLLNFLDEHRLSQNLPGRVVAFDPGLAGPHLVGWQLTEAAHEVNSFLEKIQVEPPIPGGAGAWDLGRIQETLQLMLDEFNWRDGRVMKCGWEDRPEHWAQVVREHPGVFGREGKGRT